MNPLTASISDLQHALRGGQITASSLLEAHIERIELVNPAVNGLAADRFDLARKEAAQADELLASGSENLPPLVGIPCTIKEFLGVKGMPQTGGILWRKDVVAEENATVVQRLRDAGAIVMGVTNVPEGGLWLETYNGI